MVAWGLRDPVHRIGALSDLWVFLQVSEMCGGLGICSMEAVFGKYSKEQIIEVNYSATALLGESQEEDRRNIADLVLQQMEVSQLWRACSVVGM